MAAAVVLGVCALVGLKCDVRGDLAAGDVNISVTGTVPAVHCSVGSGNSTGLRGFVPGPGVPPPITDGTVANVISVLRPLPLYHPGDTDAPDPEGAQLGDAEGWADAAPPATSTASDQPWYNADYAAGQGSAAAAAMTEYPLPIPVFQEGKVDVGTGTALAWTYRSSNCAPQVDNVPGPQTLALGWWSVNPRHPERGSIIIMCDGDRGMDLVSTGMTSAGGDGGVVVACPGRTTRGRTYDDSCTTFRFTNNRCVAAATSAGRVFSYIFRCRGTGN